MKSKKSWLDRFESKGESEQAKLDRIKAEILAEDAEPHAGKTSRRSFVARLGVSATVMALAGQAFAYLRSLKPNVLYEEPRKFKVGTPDQFGEGVRDDWSAGLLADSQRLRNDGRVAQQRRSVADLRPESSLDQRDRAARARTRRIGVSRQASQRRGAEVI